MKWGNVSDREYHGPEVYTATGPDAPYHVHQGVLQRVFLFLNRNTSEGNTQICKK